MSFFFSSRRRHTRCSRDWSSDVCSSDLVPAAGSAGVRVRRNRRGARDDARRGPRALSPCGETLEGAHVLNSHELPDAKLQEIAQRLGARAAERLDVERTAEAVVARLRTEARAEGRGLGWIQPAWLRIAAGAPPLVGAGGVGPHVPGPP